MRKLDPARIAVSEEIATWCAQFPASDRALAKSMVASLEFVSRDDYSGWLNGALQQIQQGKKLALYAVRKLDAGLWTPQGALSSRPGTSQGSEDFVYSLVANFCRRDPQQAFDHATIDELKLSKIHDIVLIDDSIGSGERVLNYLVAFLQNRTILSWWSFGWIRFHVVAYSRITSGEQRIITKLPGSDHYSRKYRKSTKVSFYSRRVFHSEWLESRWGKQYQHVLDFCDAEARLSAFVVRGVGNVMANLVFFHSVPDNIPGIFWSDAPGFQPLFGNRALPSWVLDLLDTSAVIGGFNQAAEGSQLDSEIKKLLALVKRGVRSPASIARRFDCDQRYAKGLLTISVEAGLITPTHRLLPAGRDALLRSEAAIAEFDYTMYIPQSWCAP
ncbi:hypothetical protein EZ313_17295 [Ramlibacter henchirensis]|uniref:Uncharacterized protein n=1 Tax=Ramlibacter henchirensis TaxID=204072 RepID=A0A4Z0BXH7_9BURK|nr:hypothetical protein [Ramlibacter henchirensis]TFZ02978.1 hypothetical protein EZ313_17295 [Ramlibacter henchirensis]